MIDGWSTAAEITAAVHSGNVSAREVIEQALARIGDINPRLNAYTDIMSDRALREAEIVDTARAKGDPIGALAGVPFAVKNLFDIEGLSTRAGSRINRDRPRAATDAELIKRLNGAGAILLGGLNMGEYAYDFTGRNAHDGNCRNPHNTDHMTGGSSSGSGAATAGGLAPISLGSDTNGSIRVPSSLCGIFGLKPTYGRLSRAGTFAFCDSLDHLGPFARSTADLALAYDAMQGYDPHDHACTSRPVEPATPHLDQDLREFRVGVLRGWFDELAGDQAKKASDEVRRALSRECTVADAILDGAQYGRAAAYLITNVESSAFHLDRLRTRAKDYDPETRDRFLAGALLPSTWIIKAQRVRRWWLAQVMDVFKKFDLLIVPATPCAAPRIDQDTITLGGQEVPTRPNLGVLAQPFSCIGLPIVTVPVFEPGSMPIGVQLIAPPWREDLCLRAAASLERDCIAVAHRPDRTC